MNTRSRALGALIAIALCAVSTTVTMSSAHAFDSSDRDGRLVRGATLTAAQTEVNEGDRVTLTAAVRSPRRATRITLQKRYTPPYGDASWLNVKSQKVRSRSRVRFSDVATSENREAYRVVVGYRHARPVTSRADSVKVWRWIPLSEYAPYYTTGGSGFGTLTINGRTYRGWGAAVWSHAASWEARFTPGRNCSTFRGVFGLGDISGDGSSGTIVVTADDVTVWRSPVLTPGTEVRASVPINRSYRMGLQLTDTTPGATSGRDAAESWPVIGEPALRCTGV